MKIEMTDFHDNRKLPPTDLSGLWLLISRGSTVFLSLLIYYYSLLRFYMHSVNLTICQADGGMRLLRSNNLIYK